MSTMGSLDFSPSIATSCSVPQHCNEHSSFQQPWGFSTSFKQNPVLQGASQILRHWPSSYTFQHLVQISSGLRISFNHLLLLHRKIWQQSSFSTPDCLQWLFIVSYDSHWRGSSDSQQILEGFCSC